MLTNEKINEIKERAEKATEGPWYYLTIDGVVATSDKGYCFAPEIAEEIGYDGNGEFIANSREDIPKLLAHISEQSAEIKNFKLAIRNLDALVDSVRYRINSQQDAEDVANEIAGIISDLERKVGEIV